MMRSVRCFDKLFIPICLVICLAGLSHCDNNIAESDTDILAMVGDRVVSKSDFIAEYKTFLAQTGSLDNGQARRSLLQSFIARALMISEARRRGFDRDAEGKLALTRIKNQELLIAFHQKYIAANIEISDDKLYELFIRCNTRIKARHLYAATRKTADSLYRELQNGKSFQALAGQAFEDPGLQNSGGLLGYFSLDEMEPAFEDAAFQLKPGEISQPVRTTDGYSIIRVEDRVVKPLLTDYEFAKTRSRLAAYWRKRKIRQNSQLFVDSLRNVLEVRFNPPVLKKLFLAIRQNPSSTVYPEQPALKTSMAGIENREIVHSRRGSWDVATFWKKALFTSEKQRRRIRSEENLRDFIAGLVVRDDMLEKARSENMHRRPDYQARVKKSWDDYLLTRVETQLYREIDIPEDSLRAVYLTNKQQFCTPPQLQLQEIVVNSEARANFIKTALNNGVSFSTLAQKYSVRSFSAKRGGDLGWVHPKDLGGYSKMIFALQPGAWEGPLKVDAHYFFFKCIEKKEPRLLGFDDVREKIEETLRAVWRQRIRAQKLREIRQNILVKSFPKRLRNLATSS